MCALVGACIGAVLQHCCTNIHVGPAHLRAGECVVHLYIHSKHTKQKKKVHHSLRNMSPQLNGLFLVLWEDKWRLWRRGPDGCLWWLCWNFCQLFASKECGHLSNIGEKVNMLLLGA